MLEDGSQEDIMKNYSVKHGIKLSSKNVCGTATVGSYPLYMAMFL
jgi:hypothetical protein